MIKILDIVQMVKSRLEDSETLYRAKRYDGSYYLCGYVIELALKYRICRTLNWDGYFETNKEFQGYNNFKTHNLETLLKLSGIEKIIRYKLVAEWSVVMLWNSENRYQIVGTTKAKDARDMIISSRKLLGELI